MVGVFVGDLFSIACQGNARDDLAQTRAPSPTRTGGDPVVAR
jgi:hypothetical protein